MFLQEEEGEEIKLEILFFKREKKMDEANL
jgi:hypothetical protein